MPEKTTAQAPRCWALGERLDRVDHVICSDRPGVPELGSRPGAREAVRGRSRPASAGKRAARDRCQGRVALHFVIITRTRSSRSSVTPARPRKKPTPVRSPRSSLRLTKTWQVSTPAVLHEHPITAALAPLIALGREKPPPGGDSVAEHATAQAHARCQRALRERLQVGGHVTPRDPPMAPGLSSRSRPLAKEVAQAHSMPASPGRHRRLKRRLDRAGVSLLRVERVVQIALPDSR